MLCVVAEVLHTHPEPAPAVKVTVPDVGQGFEVVITQPLPPELVDVSTGIVALADPLQV
jgi:hypothetical protein